MRTFDVNALTAFSYCGTETVFVLCPSGSWQRSFDDLDTRIIPIISNIQAKYDHNRFIIYTKKIFDEILKLDEIHNFDRIIYNPLITREVPEPIRHKFIYICHGNFPTWGRSWMGVYFQKISRDIIKAGGGSYCVGSEWLINRYENYGKQKQTFARENKGYVYDAKLPLFSGPLDINVIDPDLYNATEGGRIYPSKTKDFIFIGRACPQKRIKIALSLKRNGYPITIYTTEDPHFPDYVSDRDKELCIFDAPREVIIQDLLQTRNLVFPSSYEASGGIVSFEAASAGCKVLYTCGACEYYLKPYGAGIYIPSLTATNYRKVLDNRLNVQYSDEQSAQRFYAYFADYSLENLYKRLRTILCL